MAENPPLIDLTRYRATAVDLENMLLIRDNFDLLQDQGIGITNG